MCIYCNHKEEIYYCNYCNKIYVPNNIICMNKPYQTIPKEYLPDPITGKFIKKSNKYDVIQKLIKSNHIIEDIIFPRFDFSIKEKEEAFILSYRTLVPIKEGDCLYLVAFRLEHHHKTDTINDIYFTNFFNEIHATVNRLKRKARVDHDGVIKIPLHGDTDIISKEKIEELTKELVNRTTK